VRFPKGVPVSPLTAAAATFQASTPRSTLKDSNVLFLRETMIARDLLQLAGNRVQDAVKRQGIYRTARQSRAVIDKLARDPKFLDKVRQTLMQTWLQHHNTHISPT
jgi:hypothetical protein